jgi:cellulose synthase/poly-beta-1,6-N-acetylglucosamine synthase-like glycosyltransferase
MEVRPAGSEDISWRTVALYALIGVGTTAVFVLPTLVYVPYARTLKTVVLVIVLLQIGRLVLSGVLTFSNPETPPELDEDDLPSVSVVIPAYNEASVLPDTIEACRNLEYPAEKLEVILCYEADSTDETAAIAERAADETDYVVAVRRDEPGGGKARATNYAIERATGDVIASIDADHEFEPGAVKRAVRWFQAEPDTWCVKGRCYGRNPTDSIVALHATVDRHIQEKADLFAREVLGGFTIFGGGQAFFRREVFEEIGEFDDDVLVEDIDMSARIHASGKRLRVDPEVVTHEEHPATVRALWAQRKRWARGWLQVSRRYLDSLPVRSHLSPMQRLDTTFTFAITLIMPVMFVGIPLPAIDTLSKLAGGVPPTAYVPYSQYIWYTLGLFPTTVALLIFAQDHRDGRSHHPREYLAAVTVSIFMFLQIIVYAVAFVDEFVFDKPSVYVTTTRADDGEEVTETPGPADD